MNIQKQKLTNTTTLYRFGTPFITDAIIIKIDKTLFTPGKTVELFSTIQDQDKITLSRKLAADEHVLGLGEMLGGLNKRGKKYSIFSTDDPFHTPDKSSLYGAHPFMIFHGDETFGLFIDFPGEIEIDCGFSDKDEIVISISGPDCDCYLIHGNGPLDIIKSFLQLTGAPYLPPRWAFGYFQSRWSYPDTKSVKAIADRFRSENIPCDGIFLDLDYMDDLKIFTTSDERFPKFKQFVKEMHDNGFEIIPIIDPGVKVEKEYEVYESGQKGNHFCTDKDGKEFYSAVWPGRTVFPDFLNSDTRKWWGDLYKPFIEMGISAFWNDMNEPAIFYTPTELKKLHAAMDEFKKLKDPGMELFTIQHYIKTLCNMRSYYKGFYQRQDNGKMINHEQVHNLFGFNMARATADGLARLLPDQRYLLLSRSSYIGLHRFATIWTGDNASWWEHLGLQVRMMINCNMCGLFFTGADICGFGHSADAELAIRWSALGVGTPFFRNHAALFTRDQEPWAFDTETKDIIADLIRLRYALLPYLYSAFAESRRNLRPFVQPLFFMFDEADLTDIDDQFFLGEHLMLAPVLTSNSRSRYVTLPSRRWLYWAASTWNNRDMQVMDAGVYRIDVPLSTLPVFIPENHIIVLTEPASHTRQQDYKKIICTGLVTDHATYRLYLDDGISYTHREGDYIFLDISVTHEKNGYSITTNLTWGDGSHVTQTSLKNTIIQCPEMIFCEIYDGNGKLHKSLTRTSHQNS